MLIPLLLGCLTVIVSMGIQIFTVVFMLRHLLKIVSCKRKNHGFGFDAYVISIALLILFLGHLIQVGVWALLFMYLGEFSDFLTAFYHSMVNFSSLGYGDIVMSKEWRLLGAVEASIGVLMFGLTAGIMFAVISPLFSRYSPTEEQLRNSTQSR